MTTSEGSTGAPDSGRVGATPSASGTFVAAEGTPNEPTQVLREDPLPAPDATQSVAAGVDGEFKSAGAFTLSERNAPVPHALVQSDGGGTRRVLHLSLSEEAAPRADAQRQRSQLAPHSSTGGSVAINRSVGGQQQGSLQANRSTAAAQPPPANGESLPAATEPRRSKDTDAFIDQALRDRVDGDITAFLAAFDAALAADTPESRALLRDATDRLLRAGARTRIQLERLEARVPLPPRDGQAASVWRTR